MTMSGALKKKVLVIGAGLAGLAAAERLGRHGIQVTILEAQGRVGGRALSVKTGLADSVLAEAGPSRFPPNFVRVFKLAQELGLTIGSFYPRTGTVVGFFGGQRVERYEPSPEEFWGYASIRNKYSRIVERTLIRSALALRRQFRRIRRKVPWATYRIKEGTQRLAQTLADAGGAEIHLDSCAESVVQTKEHVTVKYNNAKCSNVLKADDVICAVPLSMVKTIEFSPSIDKSRIELAEAVPFSSAIRIFVQMDRAYWRDQGHNGFAVTDTVGEVWDPHFDDSISPALLVCYAQEELARTIGALGETERVMYAISQLEKIFPGANQHFETAESFFWDEQPWIGGGWPHARAGFAKELLAFRNPLGRVHFAGDYATLPDLLNTTEGAIESGQHVADSIL